MFSNLKRLKVQKETITELELYVMAKQSDDALQIVEQILPYFQPDYTLTINDMADMGIKRDVPIVLNSIGYEDSYEGDFTSRRALIYTLSFTAKFYLYGPVTSTLLHQIQVQLTQMMILDLMKLHHSLRMQKIMIQKQVKINND